MWLPPKRSKDIVFVGRDDMISCGIRGIHSLRDGDEEGGER